MPWNSPNTEQDPWEIAAPRTDQWAPESSGSAIPEAFNRYLRWRNEQAGPDMPNWKTGQSFRDYAKETLNSDWNQPENFMWASGVAGPVRTVQRAGTHNIIQYWPKGNPEPSATGLGSRSFLSFHAPKGNDPAYFSNIQAESPRAVGEMFQELYQQLGRENLNKMELSNILPNAVPFWERVARSPHLKGLDELQQRIMNGIELSKLLAAKKIPSSSFGWAR